MSLGLFSLCRMFSHSWPVGGGGQEWGSSALPVGPSLSVSGLLGQEPWEAGGLNNEEPEPRDLAGPPQLALSFIR